MSGYTPWKKIENSKNGYSSYYQANGSNYNISNKQGGWQPYASILSLNTKPNKSQPTGSYENKYHYRAEYMDSSGARLVFYYYIPTPWNPLLTRRFFIGVHGAGEEHYQGAHNRIMDFRDYADEHNLILIAPAFNCWFSYWPNGYTADPAYQKPDWIIEGTQDYIGHYYAWLGEDNPERELFFDPIKAMNLHDHQYLINYTNEYRVDNVLINVINNLFIPTFKIGLHPKILLYGHSGGAQFAHRFAMIHPEMIDKSAYSDAGRYCFPRTDIRYPDGLDMSSLRDDGFGGASPPASYAVDLTNIDWRQKLSEYMSKDHLVFCGFMDTEHTDPEWQGVDRREKSYNFSLSFKQFIDTQLTNSKFASIIEKHRLPTLIGVVGGHGGARVSAQDWLKSWWLNYPGIIPILRGGTWVAP